MQLLADAGIIKAPITGWPLSLGGTGIEENEPSEFSAGTSNALRHVFPSRNRNPPRVELAAGGINAAERLRSFNNVPREDGELSVRLAWEGSRVIADLNATRVRTPVDGQEWRADGTYLGVVLGNWIVAANAADRWWGPGWDGSLILSNNARPIPSISLQRRRASAPNARWLRWIGPWTTQVLFGQLESDRDLPDTRFFGWRIGFKPLPNLEIGLSRTAQWCGDGRPCDFDTFTKLVIGHDNRGQNVSAEEEPGNQLAGFDLRVAFPNVSQPFAFYTQWIGEDEQNGLPSAHMAQLGLETWGIRPSGGSYRLHMEYSETTCSAITDSDPNYGCAYNHGIYTDGYRYRGRVIGHSLDTDGAMLSAGALFLTRRGHTWQLLARAAEINRSDNSRNTLSPKKQEVTTLGISYTHDLSFGYLSIGVEEERSETVTSGFQGDESRAYDRFRWEIGGHE